MKDIRMRPLADRLIVRPIEPDERTASGIVLPETAKEKPQRGEVLAVGPGRITERGRRLPIEVEVGDTVLFARYGGTEVKLGVNGKLLVLREADVLARVGGR
jgi:chaperonin GroES